jgi:hypothetical protein
MDHETLRKRLAKAFVEKDQEKELRLRALTEKEMLQKEILSKEIEIGNLQTDVKAFTDTFTKIRLKAPHLLDRDWPLDATMPS